MEGFKRRFQKVKESLKMKKGQLKSSSLRNKEKMLKKSEQSLRELWKAIKQTKYFLSPRSEKGVEGILE